MSASTLAAPPRGRAVALARNRAGISQQQLADRTGVAKSTIARIELGDTSPNVALALAIAEHLGDTVEALFGGER